MFKLALLTTAWLLVDPSAAVRRPPRYLKEKRGSRGEEDQEHRKLFGERLGTVRDARGGAAGQAKNFEEVVAMRTRITGPTTAPLPTAAPVAPATDSPAPTLPPTEPSGCSFEGEDGTMLSFEEGDSLGGLVTLTDCFNGDPDSYPCFCDSREPDQIICPYCKFTDFLGRTVCGSETDPVTFLAQETGVSTTCSCDVVIEEDPPFFNTTVTPSCVEASVKGAPTAEPTTEAPSSAPQQTIMPTESPSEPPVEATPSPTGPPSNAPTDPAPQEPTFVMGRLNKVENGLTLSEGLSSIIIAKTFNQVLYAGTGELSEIPFHSRPSAGDTFEDTRGDNPGGWVYLSSKDATAGGIGSFTMNAAGEVINYEMIVEGTNAVNNGGRTPWGTWVMGERDTTTLAGDALQVDPFGVRDAELITLTEEGAAWEGFAYDVRNEAEPHFFMADDFFFGAIRMFTPAAVNTEDPWLMLTEAGRTQYLELVPGAINGTGTFRWSNQIMVARGNAARNYPEAQGIDVNGSTLSFVCQGIQTLFQLNLDDGTYTASSTKTGLMEGEPNEIRYVEGSSGTLLYMTELNGRRSGVHARNEAGELYTVLEGSYQPETAGFALSPNGKHMYVSFKRNGLVFDITRDDGYSFFDTISFESNVAVSRDSAVPGENRQ